MSTAVEEKKESKDVATSSGVTPVTPGGKRMPPKNAHYEFIFSVPRTSEGEDPRSGRSIVFYEYEVKIRRFDKELGDTEEKTYKYPPDPVDPDMDRDERYKKRWSELEAFDHEWSERVGIEADGSNPLHDEIRLDPFKISKWTSPLMFANTVKMKRMIRFQDYINECMSDDRLHRYVARFLEVPMEILSPPIVYPTAADFGAEEKPLQYTRRKIKRKKVLRAKGDEDDDDEVDANGVPVAPILDEKGKKITTKNQIQRDGKTINTHWMGPTADEWTKLIEGLNFTKLPHSSFAKPKSRKFSILPLEENQKGKGKIKAAKGNKKSQGFYDAIDDKAYVLTWDSSKSDVLDTFFVLGDKSIPWSVVWDQTDGQFAKLKRDATGQHVYTKQENLSFTVKYRDGPNLRTVDLIAENQADYDLFKKAFTFILWKEEGKVTGVMPVAPPPKETGIISSSAPAKKEEKKDN